MRGSIQGAISYLRSQIADILAQQSEDDTSVPTEVLSLADAIQLLVRLPHGVRS